MDIQIPITLDVIFAEGSSYPSIQEIKDYLTDFDKSQLIKAGLTLLSKSNEWCKFEKFIQEYFPHSLKGFADEIFASYSSHFSEACKKSHVPPNFVIINKQTCLELLSYIFSLEKSEKNIPLEKDSDSLIYIFYLLLHINTNRTQTPNIPEELDRALIEAYRILLTTVSYNDYTNSYEEIDFLIQCHKAQLFFEFCESNEKFGKLLDLFLGKYDFQKWGNYISSLARLFLINNKPGRWTINLDPQSQSYHNDKLLFTNLSIKTNEILKQNDDFIEFRNRPLIDFGNNEYEVIDQSFLLRKIYNSILFQFKDINDSAHIIGDFFQAYTTFFSEKVMFNSIISNIFRRHKYIKLSEPELVKSKVRSPPDYYIRNGKYVFIFEYKDVLFRKEDKISNDYNIIKTHIEEKLVCKANDKASAVYQLANVAKQILNNAFEADKGYNPDKIIIYPILVVGDRTFASPGISVILNDYFKKRLIKLGLSTANIKDISLIDIDTLINFEEDFSRNVIQLKDVLDGYYKFLKAEFPYRVKDANDVIFNIVHTNFSLATYMKTKIPPRNRVGYIDALIKRFERANLN